METDERREQLKRNAMQQTPIFMSPVMVRAMLHGRKTITRRTRGLERINTRPDFYEWLSDYDQLDIPRPAVRYDDKFYYAFTGKFNNSSLVVVTCPYGKPGDLLWVKEKFTVLGWHEQTHEVDLKHLDDTYDSVCLTDAEWTKFKKWKRKAGIHSSLFMFKSMARLWLRVTSVRVERLHDITQGDAIREGVYELDDDFISKHFPAFQYKWQEWEKRKAGGVVEQPPVGPSSGARFEALWKVINGDSSWNSNPWVWVLGFERDMAPAGIDTILTNNKKVRV